MSSAPAPAWEAFRAEAVRQVPGLPAGAGRGFDVTRHGPLDHVQRVGLRALVSDLAPAVSPLASRQSPTARRSAWSSPTTRTPSGHHCHVGFLRIDDDDRVPGGALEGLILFIDHLFTTFPFRKVFADMPEYNLPLVDGIPDEILRREGRMHAFYWHDGRFWDGCFLSLQRDAWDEVVTALLP